MGLKVPVVLFLFKRIKAVEVMKRIREVKPETIYLLADQGRDNDERERAEECRKAVEAVIDWDCKVIRNYADKNRGVYENIGKGAQWVLSQEKWAIFLEDDNLPEITFFQFCEEMLRRYEFDTRVLWICGTNYLGKYCPNSGDSYVFTRHMLPCGWASWGSKFNTFYNGDLSLCEDATIVSAVEQNYCNRKVYSQYKRYWLAEYARMTSGKKPISWDYQMDFTIKAHSLYGICPCCNQIKNIGVDTDSIHGGNSITLEMTRRFCSMDSYPIDFPLQHPKTVLPDPVFEQKIGEVILLPLRHRIKGTVFRIIRSVLGVPDGVHLKDWLKGVR